MAIRYNVMLLLTSFVYLNNNNNGEFEIETINNSVDLGHTHCKQDN